MGLWELLFGKKNVEQEVATPEAASPPDATFQNGRAVIHSIGFNGSCKTSRSGEWVICWCDCDPTTRRGGQRDSGHGSFLLYNTKQQQVLSQGLLERPNNGSVADDGRFLLEEWHFGNCDKDTIYVFNPSGEVIFMETFSGKITKSGISAGGGLVACQVDFASSGAAAEELLLFDVEKRARLYGIPSRTGTVDAFEFVEPEQTLVTVHKNIGKFRYDAGGRFLDEDKYDLSRLGCTSYSIILFAAEEILQRPHLSAERIELVLGSIGRARTAGADKDKGWKALALKLQGIALEHLGRNEEALQAYDQAMAINCKSGVKRRADALRQKLEGNGELVTAGLETGETALPLLCSTTLGDQDDSGTHQKCSGPS